MIRTWFGFFITLTVQIEYGLCKYKNDNNFYYTDKFTIYKVMNTTFYEICLIFIFLFVILYSYIAC